MGARLRAPDPRDGARHARVAHKLYVPFARTGLAMLQKMRGEKKSYVQSYVKPTMLTHDAEQAQRYADDPLITRPSR